MGFGDFFGFGRNNDSSAQELPDIFPLAISQKDFITTDVITIYAKILTDVIERVHGLSDDQTALLWDSCVMSNSQHGLISLLARAMTWREDLFLVVDSGIIRLADGDEMEKIRADYEKQAQSSVGSYISFRKFIRSDMVRLYSALEFCTVGSLNKSMNLAKAIQVKISDLRGSVSLSDAADAKRQAKEIAQSLANGKDVMLDVKDILETATPNLAAIKEAIEFLNAKRCFYLGLPAAYITGEQTGGLGSTGENDMRATERGLKSYYFSIMKPVLEALFDVKLKYKTQDFAQILASSDMLKTFALIDDTIISADNKTQIVNQLLNLPEDAKGDPAPKPVPVVVQVPPPGKPPFQAQHGAPA